MDSEHLTKEHLERMLRAYDPILRPIIVPKWFAEEIQRINNPKPKPKRLRDRKRGWRKKR